jgi:hypothetical protein
MNLYGCAIKGMDDYLPFQRVFGFFSKGLHQVEHP